MNLASELSKYGINSRSKSVRWFRDAATPDLIDYLDLVEPQGPQAERLIIPDGVVENQERPLLFFVNQGHLAHTADEEKQQIKRSAPNTRLPRLQSLSRHRSSRL